MQATELLWSVSGFFVCVCIYIMYVSIQSIAIKHYPSYCCLPLATRIVVWVHSGCHLVQLVRDDGVFMQSPSPE